MTAMAIWTALMTGMGPGTHGITYDGFDGSGNGKHIVFVTGEEEYRSEESMPQLAKILAKRHGFTCTVLFATNPDTGEIDPETLDNIPGLKALKDADLMVLFIRFRELPDDQMKLLMDYVNSGKPMVALRTSTHAFRYVKDPDNAYAKLSFNSESPRGGFGREVLGETWVDHYGVHQGESTRGVPAEGQAKHPILRGCTDIWGPSDVYALTTLKGDCEPVLMGQVLTGMEPTDPPNPAKSPVPVAWTKTYTVTSGQASKVFVTTMGHAGDFQSEGVRRMLVNACYWALGMSEKIDPASDVALVGDYAPNHIGVGGHKKGLRPAHHAL